MSSSIYCIRYYRLCVVYLVLKTFYTSIFYFEINNKAGMKIFIFLLFSWEQLNKIWKKTFETFRQLLCFVGHPVCNV